ncbi:hypothetical protein GCM10010218_63380 [Streptomyces mashuensis]|uniref:Uncharacterized protein n=1 Tax=Streptomyces mashuensis TaxID=33904 RepID=A0A919EGA8_9ACTN|nr:Rv3235 family protein [Streptomyces mashuensis]GHF73504.1 hypothetical protein GCM10010218_63380 [Streptomyces mashuensis]
MTTTARNTSVRNTGTRTGGPGRGAPPRRTDTRRPTGRGGPAGPHALAALRHERERAEQRRNQLHYWFAERLLLTLSGQRPVHWMLGYALPAAYDQLAELAPGAPLRPLAAGRPVPYVERCDGFRPRPGVIEAFARISTGDRLRAMAFRLEHGTDRRWRCSAVELGADRRNPRNATGTEHRRAPSL